MDPTQMQMYVNSFMMRKYMAEVNNNKKEADDFLKKNKAEKGVVETPSGLQYLVMQEGNGMKPRPYDSVMVAYKGYDVKGTVFDSTSTSRPRKFMVQGIIKGWSEALQLMSTGAKYKLFIPPQLGYGSNPPQGSTLKPNEVLIFEVELLKVIPGKEQKPFAVMKPLKK